MWKRPCAVLSPGTSDSQTPCSIWLADALGRHCFPMDGEHESRSLRTRPLIPILKRQKLGSDLIDAKSLQICSSA